MVLEGLLKLPKSLFEDLLMALKEKNQLVDEIDDS